MRSRAFVRGLGPILAVALLACQAAPQSNMLTGTTAAGPWSAFVFEHKSDGVCLEIRSTGRDGDRFCNLGDGGFTWTTDDTPGREFFVAGTLPERSASTVRVQLAGGGSASGPVAASPEVTDMRFFVVSVPAGARLLRIDVLDGAGQVIAKIDFG